MDSFFAVFGLHPVEEEPAAPAENSLQSGFISLGSACDRTGTAYCDDSKGPSYGDGHRFDHEETAFITKIPSVRRR